MGVPSSGAHRRPASPSFTEVVRALLESEETYQLIFARERDATSLIDGETRRFLDVNDAWCALYGYSRDEAQAMTPRDVFADPAQVRANPLRPPGDPPDGPPGRPRLRWHRKRDGTVFPVELVCGSFLLGGRRATYVVVHDVSERIAAEEARRAMEARLARADRLAALGQLAATVGHEINNPLAWMLGHLELVSRELRGLDGQLDEPTRARLEERVGAITQGAERVQAIVRELRTVSQPEAEPARVVDLHRVLDLCAEMAGHELAGRARLVREYGPDGLAVRGSEARVGQVFLNLLINAAQAIPEGAADHHEVRVRTFARASDTAREVVVEVEDTGGGIAPEALARLFEPFFTTKAPGEGTGLGLHVSRSIVESMSGRIEVEPREGHGARFRVVLPQADEDG